MVKRLTTEEDGRKLRDWFLDFMTDLAVQPKRKPWLKGFLIGPSQLCKRAGVDTGLGSSFLGKGKTAKDYVPFAEHLRRLVVALREMLEELGHPRAPEVTVIGAFIKSSYLELEDVADFVESEGVEGWIKEEDCSGLHLGKLDERGRLVVEETYHFLLWKKQAAQSGD